MKIHVKFVDDAGAELVATLDDETKTVVTSIGKSGTYTRDATANTLTVQGDWNATFQFEGPAVLEPGHAARYTRTDGGPSGTATIVSIE